MKKVHDEIINGRATSHKGEKSFKIYILIQYIWYQNIDKSDLALKPWKPPWKKQQYMMKDVFSLLYGDILTVVESWPSQILFFTVESVHWFIYRRIFIALIWVKVNIIQQRKLVLMMRRRSNVRKKIIRVNTLLIKKTAALYHLIYYCLLIIFTILFVVFISFVLLCIYIKF